MSELLKNNISTYADLTAYNADTNKDYPNVSYIYGTDKVKYGTNILVAKYNVTTTGSATKLLNSTTGISSMTIDGVKQQSVVANYTFSTSGEHIVKYNLVNQTTISEETFFQCTNLSNIGIPDSVSTISNNAFNASGLTGTLTIPDNVTNIDYNVFRNCTGLTSIIIGSGVTSINTFVFQSCSNLTNITCLATTPPTLANKNAFNDTNNCPIYVPAESVDAYKAATNWSTYASRIQPIS